MHNGTFMKHMFTKPRRNLPEIGATDSTVGELEMYSQKELLTIFT